MGEEKDNLQNEKLENSISNQENQNNEVDGSTSEPVSKLNGIIGIIKWFMMLPTTLKLIILYCLGGLVAIILVIFLIFIVQAAPSAMAEELFGFLSEGGQNVSSFFQNMADFITDPFRPDLEEKARKQQESYYKKLQEVYEEFEEKYDVQIDTTLITATLFYERTIDDYLLGDLPFGSEDNDEFLHDEIDFYKKAKKHIKALAKFQIIENSTYSTCGDTTEYQTVPENALDIAKNWTVGGYNSRKTYNVESFRDITYTKADGTSSTIKWCNYWDANTQLLSLYQEDKAYVENLKDKYDECVASVGSCDTQKEAYEEASVRYYANWIDNGLYTEDGTFQCEANDTFGALSPYLGDGYDNQNFVWDSASGTVNKTGAIDCSSSPAIYHTYSLDVSREGVYYHKLLSRTKLLSSKSFIEKYYPEQTEADTEEKTYQLAVKIVEGIYDLYESIAERNTYAIASNLCPNGVQVISGTGAYARDPSKYPIGTFSLEDYVAMVVNGENNSGYDEAMKAQIVAARTYTLARTDGCTKPIRNSVQDQVARANPSEKIKQLVKETAGEVLMFNGKIFSSEYDSFDGTCRGGMCTAVYTKLPNGETHTVTIPESFNEGIGGHGRGMSQCAANYMAHQGSTYQQILEYFYSPGVEIVIGAGTTQDTANSGTTLSPSGIVAALSSSGYTLESYSNEMFTAVRNSGLATRQAVLTVASYATNKFYNMTGGLKLNYTYGGGHGSSYQIYGFYTPFARDCSSFISWVLYNAGFEYKNYVSGDWGTAGTKYPISEKRGVVGDLIWFDGHIALIIGADEKGYYTAEAYSTKSGIINHFYPYTGNSKSRYTVDMTSFYEKNINISNYPGGGV